MLNLDVLNNLVESILQCGQEFFCWSVFYPSFYLKPKEVEKIASTLLVLQSLKVMNTLKIKFISSRCLYLKSEQRRIHDS